MTTIQRQSLTESAMFSKKLARPATEALNQQLDESTRCKRRKLSNRRSCCNTDSNDVLSHRDSLLSTTGLHLALAFDDEHSNESLPFPPIHFDSDEEDDEEEDCNNLSMTFPSSRKLSSVCLGKHFHGMVRSRTIRSSIFQLDSLLQSQ